MKKIILFLALVLSLAACEKPIFDEVQYNSDIDTLTSNYWIEVVIDTTYTPLLTETIDTRVYAFKSDTLHIFYVFFSGDYAFHDECKYQLNPGYKLNHSIIINYEWYGKKTEYLDFNVKNQSFKHTRSDEKIVEMQKLLPGMWYFDCIDVFFNYEDY